MPLRAAAACPAYRTLVFAEGITSAAGSAPRVSNGRRPAKCITSASERRSAAARDVWPRTCRPTGRPQPASADQRSHPRGTAQARGDRSVTRQRARRKLSNAPSSRTRPGARYRSLCGGALQEAKMRNPPPGAKAVCRHAVPGDDATRGQKETAAATARDREEKCRARRLHSFANSFFANPFMPTRKKGHLPVLHG